MNVSRSDSTPTGLDSGRMLPILLVLFVGSGCSALVYEIVWFQLLQLVIGSSAISLGVLLGTFMGGMCVGSLALPRVVSARYHPLRVYALLELGIGVLGVLLLYGMPAVGRIYAENIGHGSAGFFVRGVVCALCLLPPTVLMGATLPAIARWIETTPRGVARLGFFYGANIAGAVCGCILAGFYLLRIYDMATATYVAVSINALVAAVGLALARISPYTSSEEARDTRIDRGAWGAYVTIGLSGMCALAAEVIWTRQLSLMLGASVYTFSIILAVFLTGLGLGSSVGAVLARQIHPRLALGACQMLLTATIAWAAYSLAKTLPYWPIDPTLSATPWITFQLDVVRAVWAVFPAACLWGASFPLALGAAVRPGQDPGRLVAGVYSANTVGAIVGAVGFSLLFVARWGTQVSQRVLIVVSALAALIMLLPQLWLAINTLRNAKSSSENRSAGGLPAACVLTVLAILAPALAWTVPAAPRGLIAYGRNLPTLLDPPEFLHVADGMNASIAVSEFSDGTRNFHVSGKVVASSEPQDMRLQRMLGHIPALIHPQPKSVLIVGCGAGVTAGSFVLHPDIERIVICEIEPLIPAAAGEYFDAENHGVMNDPRVEVVFDDARHYIVTTKDRFDIITSDPIHPWVKGAAALYSKEYFELCKARLNPGGVVTQWVPLYESTLEAVQSEVATFFKAFPNGTVWSNDTEGEGYDVVLLGQVGRTTINLDELQDRMNREDHAQITEALAEIELGTALRLMSTYAGCADDLAPWLVDAEINHDRSLRLQYLAGMGLNSYEAMLIFDYMISYRRYPEDLFEASGSRGTALRALLGNE